MRAQSLELEGRYLELWSKEFIISELWLKEVTRWNFRAQRYELWLNEAMKLRVRGEILRALTQRSYNLWAMTPRSYELLCLLSDWSTDDCHSWAIHRYTVTVHLESVEDWESQCGYMVCLPIDWLMDTTALGEVIGWVVDRSKVSVIWNLCKTETVNVVTWFAERLIDWWKL